MNSNQIVVFVFTLPDRTLTQEQVKVLFAPSDNCSVLTFNDLTAY